MKIILASLLLVTPAFADDQEQLEIAELRRQLLELQLRVNKLETQTSLLITAYEVIGKIQKSDDLPPSQPPTYNP